MTALADWSVETRRGDDAFAGLAAQWDDLHARCAAASPFQVYAWQSGWWRTYGVPGRLRVFLVRHGGRLVGAAAFQIVRRGGCRVLVPLGGSLADFTDVLLDDAKAEPAARELAAALVRDRGWQVIDFPEARPGGVTARLLAGAWTAPRWSTDGSLCLELPAKPIEDLVRELPQHSRKTVRRRLNQLRKAAPEIREVPALEAGPAISRLLLLHERQWRGRGGNPAHFRPAFASFLARSAEAMILHGQAVLYEYRFEGELLASSLLLVGGDLVGGYLFGVDPSLRGRVDVTTMLLADALPLAHRLGRPTMSMLRGAEAHKTTWRPLEARNQRVLLVRPGSVRGVAYARGLLAGRRLKAFAKTRAPWLTAVRDRLVVHSRTLIHRRPGKASPAPATLPPTQCRGGGGGGATDRSNSIAPAGRPS